MSGEGFATATDAPELDISGTALTVEVWVKHDGQSDTDAILVNKGAADAGYRLSFVGEGEEPGLRFAITDLDQPFFDVFSDGGVPAGQWTHVAATYDGAQLALYLNGELDNTREVTNAIGANENPLRVGTDNGGTGRFYSGELDELRLWNVGRNLFEMQESPYTPLSGSEPGLVAYYTFDDVQAFPVPDLAGNNDVLEVVGSASLITPGVYPTPPNLFIRERNGQVDLQWDERLGPNGENGASQFRVYRSMAPDGSDRQEVATVDGGITSFTDTGVMNGMIYYYEVTSIDADGRESDYSKMVAARPYSALGGGSLAIQTDGFASMPDRPSLDISGTALTVEVWVKHDGQSDADAILVNKGAADAGYRLSFVGEGEEPGLRFAITDLDQPFFDVFSDGGVPAGQWTHVAATYDGAQLALYLNGELDNTREVTNAIGANENPLRVGTDDGGAGRFYSGELDELRLWNVGRTGEEVAAAYREELVGDEDGLVTYFRFNEIGNSIAQSSGVRHAIMALFGEGAIDPPGVFPLPPHGYANGEDASAAISWHNREANAPSQFKIYRSTSPGGSDRQELDVTDGTVTAYVDTGLTNGTAYYYEITTINADGQESDYSHVDPALAFSTPGGTSLFVQSGGFAAIPDRPSLDISGTALTVEVWVKHDGQSDTDAILVNKGSADAGYSLSFVGEGNDPGIRFAIADIDQPFWTVSSNAGIPANQWTHVAASYDGSQLALYVNGEVDDIRDITRNIDANDNPLHIGADNGGTGRFYSGELDELRLWNVGRTGEEVAAAYREELVGDEEGLVAYFRFDEPGSPVAISSAALAMTADLVNDASMGGQSPLPSEGDGTGPVMFALEGSYPNPFSTTSTIRFTLPRAERVGLAVYDVLGRHVTTLVDSVRPAGTHDVRFDVTGLANGVYIVRLTAGDEVDTHRLTILH